MNDVFRCIQHVDNRQHRCGIWLVFVSCQGSNTLFVKQHKNKWSVYSSIGHVYSLVIAQLVERWIVAPQVMCSNHIDEIKYLLS